MDEDDPHRQLRINPILIGLLGVIAGAIMVATYQICSSICNYRRRMVQGSDRHGTVNSTNQNVQHNQHDIIRPRDRSTSTTASMSTPRLNIPIFRYNKDCNEDLCAVCLGEFKEGEQIRVLPDCLHFFHVSCIDRWLNLHSNCPICRADTSTPEQVAVSLPEYSGRSGQQPLEVNRLPDFGV